MFSTSLTNPGSIAIIGASKNPGKPGGSLVINLVEGGFKGNIYPVNPKEQKIHGLKCYNSLEQLPETDMAIIALSAKQCVDAAEKLASKKSTQAFIIISAGFTETGTRGKQLEDRLRNLAEEFKLAIIGPNCIGVLNRNIKAVFISPTLDTAAIETTCSRTANMCIISRPTAKK